MLLGHGAIAQFGVAEALPGFVVNAGTVDVTLGQSASLALEQKLYRRALSLL